MALDFEMRGMDHGIPLLGDGGDDEEDENELNNGGLFAGPRLDDF
jgi:hypothetical protein